MAIARQVIADTGSNEVAELRLALNTLILMLETAGASITAGATADEVLSAWSAGIAAGKDNNPAGTPNIVSTGREIAGVSPSPNVPLTARRGFVPMGPASGF